MLVNPSSWLWRNIEERLGFQLWYYLVFVGNI